VTSARQFNLLNTYIAEIKNPPITTGFFIGCYPHFGGSVNDAI